MLPSQQAPILRACQPCRSAKVRCDLSRPVCGRCQRRKTACFGYSDEKFRDETAIVGARVERQISRQGGETTLQSGLGGKPGPLPAQSTPGESEDMPETTPWLKVDVRRQIPSSVTGDLDTRAVESFFANWIMWPCNHTTTLGYFHDMPAIYEQSLPGTAIRLSIEALALADIPDQQGKARTRYGHALGRVRAVIADESHNRNDSVLAALLIIDTFELMHLDRSEPLGPHTIGLFHVLRARGADQLFNRRGYTLWRMAHHRLQARQLLLRESPYPEQEKWIASFQTEQPDLHIITHVFEMCKLNATAAALLKRVDAPRGTYRQEADEFLQRSRELLTDCQKWASRLPEIWKPATVAYESTSSLPVILSDISVHHDIWLAYMWNYHNASMIIMRESVIDVLDSLRSQGSSPSASTVQEATSDSVRVIQELSTALLQTMPQLLGIVDFRGMPRSSDRDLAGYKFGKGLGGFFAFYALWTVRACKHGLPDHKKMAGDILDWLHQHNTRL